jgi:ABC-type glycerol-3-phosphate transport system substrate-binding protein
MQNPKKLRSFSARLMWGLVMVATLAAGCTKGPDAETLAASKKVEINIWGVIDDVDAYQTILSDYRKLHPNATLNYRRFRLEEYENELLNALAEDRGPDVFMIHNTWVGKYMSKLLVMPLQTKTAAQFVEGTLKKELVWKIQTEPTVSIRQFKLDYPDVVANDFIRTVNVSTNPEKRDYQQRVVAIPMSVDSLAMFANKDLLNAAGIANIPEDWDTFQEAVKLLVKTDDTGAILQAGAAMGTGKNIERSPDIISALMMQNGAEMAAADGTPTFNRIPAALQGQRDMPPAYQALTFYTDFSNPGKDVYTWNDQQPNSLDAFIQGKVAFFFGYSYHLPVIRARAPRLNLAMAKMPQIQGNPVVNYANYWGWTVSKKTKSIDLSWSLLNFMRKPEQNKKFLDKTQRPAALRSQLPEQLENENVGVFAAQVLTAKSWYKGNDPVAMEDAMVSLIDEVRVADPEKLSGVVNNAVSKISQTIPYTPY